MFNSRSELTEERIGIREEFYRDYTIQRTQRKKNERKKKNNVSGISVRLQ